MIRTINSPNQRVKEPNISDIEWYIEKVNPTHWYDHHQRGGTSWRALNEPPRAINQPYSKHRLIA